MSLTISAGFSAKSVVITLTLPTNTHRAPQTLISKFKSCPFCCRRANLNDLKRCKISHHPSSKFVLNGNLLVACRSYDIYWLYLGPPSWLYPIAHFILPRALIPCFAPFDVKIPFDDWIRVTFPFSLDRPCYRFLIAYSEVPARVVANSPPSHPYPTSALNTSTSWSELQVSMSRPAVL